MNFKAELYRRLVVLMTLNVDVNGELFAGTAYLAGLAAAHASGLEGDLGHEMAEAAVITTIKEVTDHREAIRTAIRQIPGKGCENPKCASCRIGRWAHAPVPAPKRQEEPNYEELLRHQRKGPVN